MNNSKKLLLMLVIGVALITATLAACAPALPPAEPTNPVIESPPKVQRITVEESKAAFDSGEAVFLDVRSQSSYATRHIPGALSTPLVELEPRISELAPGQWIIPYCT